MRRSYVLASSLYAHLFEVIQEYIEQDMASHKTRLCWKYTFAELSEQVHGRLRRYIIRGRPELEHASSVQSAVVDCLHRHLLLQRAFEDGSIVVWVSLWNDWKVICNQHEIWVGTDEGVLSSFYKDLFREDAELHSGLIQSQTQRLLLRLLHLDEALLFC